MSVEVREKQPNDVVHYLIDMVDYFEELTGDDIQSADVSVTGTGVAPDLYLATPASVTLIGDPPKQIKVRLAGGVSGRTYKVTAIVTLESGQVEEVDFKVRVRDL